MERMKKWSFRSYFDLSRGQRSGASVCVELLYSDAVFCLLVPVVNAMEPPGSSARGPRLYREGGSQLLSLGFPAARSESLPLAVMGARSRTLPSTSLKAKCCLVQTVQKYGKKKH